MAGSRGLGGGKWPGSEVAGDPGGAGRGGRGARWRAAGCGAGEAAAVSQVGSGVPGPRCASRRGLPAFLCPGRAAPPRLRQTGSCHLLPGRVKMLPPQGSRAFPWRKLPVSSSPELFSRAAQYLIICWAKSFTYVARLVCLSAGPHINRFTPPY